MAILFLTEILFVNLWNEKNFFEQINQIRNKDANQRYMIFENLKNYYR